MRDLWPEDLIEDVCNFSRTPAIILREQAALLGKKTNNLVEAEVVRVETRHPGEFGYAFFIVTPVLDGYKYKLFTIEYNLNMYPVSLDISIMEILSDLDPKYQGYLDGNCFVTFDQFLSYQKQQTKILAQSETEFVGLLSKIFCTPTTKKIIGILLAVCREV